MKGRYYTHIDNNVWCYGVYHTKLFLNERLGQIEGRSSCPKKKEKNKNSKILYSTRILSDVYYLRV